MQLIAKGLSWRKAVVGNQLAEIRAVSGGVGKWAGLERASIAMYAIVTDLLFKKACGFMCLFVKLWSR